MAELVYRTYIDSLSGPFETWPLLLCPSCKIGPLEPKVEKFETTSSIEARAGAEIFDGWTWGYFHGRLTCSVVNCSNNYVVAGEWKELEPGTAVGNLEDPHMAGMYVHHVLPPFPLIDFPSRVPVDIRTLTTSASSVLLSDPSAAASRMRAAVEKLLDLRNIRKYPSGAVRAKKNKLTLHRRIELFHVDKPDAADFLMAMKWIGNAASHESDPLPLGVVLDGIEFFAKALHLIYDDRDRQLRSRAATVNRQKGPRRAK